MKNKMSILAGFLILNFGIFSFFCLLPKSQQNIRAIELKENSPELPMEVQQEKETSVHIKTVALPEETTKDKSSHKQFSRQILMSIPNLEEIRKSREGETHSSVSEMTIRAGELIGLIEEKMEADPTFYSDGIQFFSDCVTHKDFSYSVRALCYYHLKNKAPSHPTLLSSEIPRSIMDAALGLDEK